MHALRGRLGHPGPETGAEEQEDVGRQPREEHHDAEEEGGAGDDGGATEPVGHPAHGQDPQHQEGARDAGHEHDDARAHPERRLDVGREHAQTGALEVVQRDDESQDRRRSKCPPCAGPRAGTSCSSRVPGRRSSGKSTSSCALDALRRSWAVSARSRASSAGLSPEGAAGPGAAGAEGSLTSSPTRMIPVAVPGPPMDSSGGCYARIPGRHQKFSTAPAARAGTPTRWPTWRRTPGGACSGRNARRRPVPARRAARGRRTPGRPTRGW